MEKPSKLAPFMYIKVITSYLIDIFIFSEGMDPLSLIGTLLVCYSCYKIS